MSEESYDEQLSRGRLMAKGDATWDLSDNDTTALSAVLARLDGLEKQQGLAAQRYQNVCWHCSSPITQAEVESCKGYCGSCYNKRPILNKGRL